MMRAALSDMEELHSKCWSRMPFFRCLRLLIGRRCYSRAACHYLKRVTSAANVTR